MNRFALARVTSYDDASTLLADRRYALPVLKAGGMDLLDHLKEGLLEPDLLIDVRTVEAGPRITARDDGGIRLSPAVTLAEIATSALVQERVPALAQAAASAATPQVRNVASAAGNLLQRPRCWYYRNEEFDCLKKTGHKCFAYEGENTYHAIFGDGPCYIVHPSNLAPPLLMADGTVTARGSRGERILTIDALYHLPGDGPRSEHELDDDEVITSIDCAAAPTSAFYGIKAKQSFDWPLVFAVAALTLDGDRIASARLCAGAVAPVPWALPAVDDALRGVSIDDDAALRTACAHAVDGATPLSKNAYKTKLLPVAVRRAVRLAAGREAVS